jgi:proline dehydrogenase
MDKTRNILELVSFGGKGRKIFESAKKLYSQTPMRVSFTNTEIAFSSQSNSDLRRSYWLFKLINSPKIVSIGKWLVTVALTIRFPIKWLLKPTIFRQFCGGETIEESRKRIEELGKYNIKSVLDYAAEGNQNEKDFDMCVDEIIRIINEAKRNKNIGFAVFKPTGVARFHLLEKVSEEKSVLTEKERREYDRVYERFDLICKTAYEAGVPVFIDAEESWIQRAVDVLAEEMMRTYNKERAIVYNTFQMYRKDRLEFLIDCFLRARKGNYFLGVKVVRGAYMEKERARAAKMKYPSPIHDTKEITDSHFNAALRFCMEHLDRISFCCASHNEDSCMMVLDMMKTKNLAVKHEGIYFSQLLGMSDHISFNLAAAGYNVSKYVPYGPVRDVIPYLIRRAQENTSVKGQSSRELNLILKEIERRKLKRK